MKIWLGYSKILVRGEGKKYHEIGWSDFNTLRRKHKRRKIRVLDLQDYSLVYPEFPSRYRYCFQNDYFIDGSVIYYHQVWNLWKKS